MKDAVSLSCNHLLTCMSTIVTKTQKKLESTTIKKTRKRRSKNPFEKKVQQICDLINKSSDDLLSLYPEERFVAIIGALYFNLALNICSKTLGIDETHRMLSLTEQSLNNYLLSADMDHISTTVH
jgi:hypothetical protein